MAKTISKPLAVPGSVAAGAASEVDDMGRKCVTITGTFTATFQVQISNDGSGFVNEGAALTAAGSLEITKPCSHIRINCTAFTSSTTPVGIIRGEY